MTSKKLVCALPGCDKHFVPRTHNQKYCGYDCLRVATNQDIKRKYYDNRARILGLPRFCSICETTKLSRYNEDTVCSSCQGKATENRNALALSIASAINLAV